ncbi:MULTISPECIES: serine/threonine-protein kinase [unclassified Tolypothrix]|uniref:serine/threonine-protein kinase n=1 Tax=unclassified Tolypothrix TaxID=2649714 RepID=UPI0005EAAE75|nr:MULTISPECIES: serine/threonine-protein kinase [unclassified Tolypothrix]BAY92814.1 serine/threonine protein kinase [Microchaete diplosiphon NIES-3275]EKF04110.1 kinase domain protein [Tolypothrix sp. PCC 7601]MBE9087907.1 serine/threonine protein kinase [Tolypothrix sp. LEGE 11397]UYD26732.1 serine/threonine protein kinase [Tolypothrix sp. PCC 7712]UYD37408.1 serine/threonine protein kinase [Tolypothrix sp. PCC 7601]
MSYCLNPRCPKPENSDDVKFCLSCGYKLLLKERYRAIKPIGQGGFGRTFLAVDEDKPSKPRCVIKQFYPQAQGTNTVQKAVELFNQEAVQLDELGQHPQIPALLAYFTQDDRQYLVQEFIDGKNLAQESVEQGAFNEEQIRQLLNDLLPVLQFCHARHVIHRDIKPENIILRASDRKLVLVDFGASKSATSTSLNRTGTSIGSPEYVAPEQIRGRAIFASDIYSLGATCIRLLTERSPFDSYDINNDSWIWQQYLTNPVSQELTNILNKMLESIPRRRYQTADEVLIDLNKNVPIVATPATSIKPVNVAPSNPKPAVSPKSQSQIDLELEEMKTLFLGGNKPPKQQSQPQPQTPQPTNKSIIDDELEELKSKYLGNNNS